jgi:predicted amidophosphoribosyltransferase
MDLLLIGGGIFLGGSLVDAVLERGHRRFCSACGTEAPPGAKFCPNCAAALPQTA